MIIKLFGSEAKQFAKTFNPVIKGFVIDSIEDNTVVKLEIIAEKKYRR